MQRLFWHSDSEAGLNFESDTDPEEVQIPESKHTTDNFEQQLENGYTK